MTTHQRIAGLWLPLITPFNDGQLDETSLTRLVRHYAAEPVDGLILAATTGEGLMLDETETERLVAITAGTRDRALPIFLGISGADTRKVAAAIARSASWPIDGYLIPCPYYVRPPQDGLYRHFATLAGATGRPIIVYNIPYRTGVNLANATLLRLAELPNIVGVKDCCVDQAQSFDLMRARPPGFAVLTGEDALFYGAIAHGADGGILAAAHVETARFAAVRNALIAGRREAEIEKAAAECRALGSQSLAIRTDVTRENDVERLVGTAVERYGRLDVAFNNAGFQERRAPLEQQGNTVYDDVFDANVRSIFLCFRHQLPVMFAHGQGRIVVNASVSGLRNPNPGLSLYSASKAAAISLMRSAAMEAAPRGVGINAIAPGRVITDMMLRSGVGDMSSVAAALPLRRMGRPEEVAEAVVWLLSDAASYVVGHVLAADGGFLAS